MNTTEVVLLALCALAVLLAGGSMTAAAVIIRRALREAAWNKYRLRLSASAEFVPAAAKNVPARAQAAGKPGSASSAAHGPGHHLASLAAVPGETLTRRQAAARLGVSERTLRRHAAEWQLEEIPRPGRETLVTAESVGRRKEEAS